MKRVLEWLKKPAVYTLVVNLCALILSFTLFQPYFEENDDTYLAMIAEGAFGQREPHLMYINYAYGCLLRLLYGLLPGFRWYCLLQYILSFAALCLITRVLCDYKNGRLIAFLTVLASFFELYVSLQYTKTAVAASIAGYIGILHYVRKKSRGYLIFGSILLIFGALLRDNSFFLASIFAFVLFLSEFYRKLRKESAQEGEEAAFGGSSRFFRVLFLYVRAFASAFVIILCFLIYNAKLYGNDPVWSAYMDYSETRTKLIDYRYDLMDYNNEQVADWLSEVWDISENDALIYMTWQFSDNTILTVEKMKAILAAAEPRAFDLTMLKAYGKHIYDDILIMNPVFLGAAVFFFLLVLLAVCRAHKPLDKTALLYLALSLAALFAILTYYQYSGRWTHRIVYATLIAMLFCFIYEFAVTASEQDSSCRTFDSETGSEERTAPSYTGELLLAAFLIAISVCPVLMKDRLDYESHKRTENDYNGYIAYTAEHKDKLFVIDSFTFQNAWKYDVLRPCPEGSLDNLVFISSWYVNSPITDGVVNRFGYENPFRTLAGADENVIVADNIFIREKLTYLNEHYGGGYDAEYLDTKCGYDEYKIVKNDNSR
ncbi:MAG: hypothetical protein IJT16_01120 [Lachnospiraceae bacterium]|nr:hypothetical protein [Lachnospiraceae bacterium]